jgi:hypothetical protein
MGGFSLFEAALSKQKMLSFAVKSWHWTSLEGDDRAVENGAGRAISQTNRVNVSVRWLTR